MHLQNQEKCGSCVKRDKRPAGCGGFSYYSDFGSDFRLPGRLYADRAKDHRTADDRGDLLGLVSTNALELGIDIGSIGVTVLIGYPGTRSSFWQQTGRAGRSKKSCTNYLILDHLPMDQYIGLELDGFLMRAVNMR